MDTSYTGPPADDVVKVLLKSMRPIMSIFGYNLKSTRAGRLEQRVRVAAQDFQGCVDVLPPDRVEDVLQSMNIVSDVSTQLSKAKKTFRGGSDYNEILKTFENEVIQLEKYTQRASTERYMVISKTKTTKPIDMQAAASAITEFGGAAAELGIDPVKFAKAAPVILQQMSAERKNQPAPTHHFHYMTGQVTVNHNCHCKPASTPTASSIPEPGCNELSVCQEQHGSEVAQLSTSTSASESEKIDHFVSTYTNVVDTFSPLAQSAPSSSAAAHV